MGPSYGPMLGGLAVTISGPCFDELSNTSNVVCKFQNIKTPAKILDDTRALCILPMLLKTGRIPVALSVDGGHTYSHTGLYTLGKYISVINVATFLLLYTSLTVNKTVIAIVTLLTYRCITNLGITSSFGDTFV